MTSTAEAPGVARVAVPKPLFQSFDYAVPAHLGVPAVGARVRVPFGRQQITGVCVARDPADAHANLKPIGALLDAESAFGAELYELALWLARYYHHPLGEVLATVLPAEARRGAPLDIVRPESWRLTGARADLTRAPRQRALFAHLEAAGGAATTDALRAAGFDRPLIRALAGKGLITRGAQPDGVGGTGPADAPRESPPELTGEQAAALAALGRQPGGFAATLLEGVTGSGKTEVYLRLIETVRAAGRQVLVLVPEIALTPQTVGRFERRFGAAAVAAQHSNLTDAARLQTWLKCRAGETGILIGTRSAVLTPFRDLGLIVVDEEHDPSYKQQDGLRYSARDVAVKRAQQLGIPLLLGSATPSLESLHNAHTGRYHHLRLTSRATGARLPRFELLDIRGQKLRDGLSDGIVRTIRRHLQAGCQVLVFLNRRGYAPTYLCPRCAWQATCDACDMPMTLHRDPRALICHHCGSQHPVPSACPECGQGEMLPVGAGTQRTEAGLAELFPDVPLYRIDRDTVRSRRRMEAQLDAIRRGAPALLVGTQMLAKGHHFPAVTLVAVINADGGFMSPDFRAPERTAQLIVQVAGRAGRAERAGEVWIQSYQPDSAVLRALIREGYPGFAGRELATRQAGGLPPFRPMALLRAEGPDARRGFDYLARIRALVPQPVECLGPAPAPVPRVANRHRHQLLLLADGRAVLHRGLEALHAEIAKPPPRVRVAVDVDPYDTF